MQKALLIAATFCGVQNVSGFLSSRVPHGLRLYAGLEGPRLVRRPLATPFTMSASVKTSPMTVPDEVGIFGRLAEAQCVCAEGGDESTGEMRTSPRGPKWIASYVSRTPASGGPPHVASWVGGLFGDAPAITFESFALAMSSLPFTQPFAAPLSTKAAAVPSEAGLRQCWAMLGGKEGVDALTPEMVAEALVKISDGDGLQYSDFDYSLRSMIDWQTVGSDDSEFSNGPPVNDGWEEALNDQSASDMLELNLVEDGGGLITPEGVITSGAPVPDQAEEPVKIALVGDDADSSEDQLSGLDLDLSGSETGSGLWIP